MPRVNASPDHGCERLLVTGADSSLSGAPVVQSLRLICRPAGWAHRLSSFRQAAGRKQTTGTAVQGSTRRAANASKSLILRSICCLPVSFRRRAPVQCLACKACRALVTGCSSGAPILTPPVGSVRSRSNSTPWASAHETPPFHFWWAGTGPRKGPWLFLGARCGAQLSMSTVSTCITGR